MSSNYIGLIIGSMIAYLLWIDPVPWLVFRAATGFSLSVMFVVAESWLNSSSTSYNRGRLLSVYSVVYIVSMGAGQPLMAFFPPAAK